MCYRDRQFKNNVGRLKIKKIKIISTILNILTIFDALHYNTYIS